MPEVLESGDSIVESKITLVNSLLVILFVGLQGGILAVNAPAVGIIVFGGSIVGDTGLGSSGAILIINTLQAIFIGTFAYLSGIFIKKFSNKSSLYIGLIIGFLFDFIIGMLLLSITRLGGIPQVLFIVLYVFSVCLGGVTLGILYNISSSSITSTIHDHKKSNLFLNLHSGFYTLGIAAISFSSLIFSSRNVGTDQIFYLFFAVAVVQALYLIYSIFTPFVLKENPDKIAKFKQKSKGKLKSLSKKNILILFSVFIFYIGIGIINGGVTPYFNNVFSFLNYDEATRNTFGIIVTAIFFLGSTIGNFLYGAIFATKAKAAKITLISSLAGTISGILFAIFALTPSLIHFWIAIVFIFTFGLFTSVIIPSLLNLAQKYSHFRSGDINGKTLGFAYAGLWLGAFWIGVLSLFITGSNVVIQNGWYVGVFVFSFLSVFFVFLSVVVTEDFLKINRKSKI